MNQTSLTNAATSAANKSKNLIAAQVDRQARTLGDSVVQTAHDLEHIGDQLRQTGTIGSAAELADWAARYVKTAGEYLQQGTSERFVADLETFSRDRPWAVAAGAAAAGFAIARVIKSSSARRLRSADYVESSGNDYAFESSTTRPGWSPQDTP